MKAWKVLQGLEKPGTCQCWESFFKVAPIGRFPRPPEKPKEERPEPLKEEPKKAEEAKCIGWLPDRDPA